MKRVSALITRLLLILLVITLAGALRLRAVNLLPVDYDEDDYLRAAQQYAAGMRQGDWQVFTRENYRSEHPPLSKIVYGFALLTQPEFPLLPDRPVSAGPDQTLPKNLLTAGRSTSALFGWLEVLLLTFLNPLAGFFLGVHTFTIKYTSQVMLEGLPVLTSLLVVACYGRACHSTRRRFWLILSAVFLGLTAAAKYYYCISGVAVLAHWLFLDGQEDDNSSARQGVSRSRLAAAAAWGALALVIFLAANPYLWPDPLNRLWQSVSYHGGYAQSEQVSEAGLPFWSPLSWLATSVPWHPGVFILRADLIILLFAMFGLQRTWKRQPVYFLWLVLGLGFLLIWPTKWPQYILLVTAPLALSAANGFQLTVSEPLASAFNRFKQNGFRKKRLPAVYDPLKQVLPWLLPGLLTLMLITVFPLLFQLAMSMADFSSTSIKDGVNGGVWREVWLGITGQVQPLRINLFDVANTGKKVHFTGPTVILDVLFSVGNLYVFELVWTVLAVTLQTALGVAVALLLNRKGVWGTKLWSVIFILPWAVPEFVAALSWSQIFEPRFGFLNLAAKSWSEQAPGMVNFVSRWQENSDFALLVLLVAALWAGFPFMLLSARAGLKLISPEVYDAAALDGAAGWQLFRQVTWPLIFPLVVPAIILRSIFTFNQFYLFTVLRTPVLTLAAISYYIFRDGRYSASAIINIVTVCILIGLVAWFNRLSRAGEGVTYA